MAEAADLFRTAKTPQSEDPIVKRVREARARAREADESLAALTQRSRSRIRVADESLAASKQEAQARVLEAEKSIKALAEKAQADAQAADAIAQARQREAQSTVREAEGLLAETEELQASLQKRLKLLKIAELPSIIEPEIAGRGSEADPVPRMKREVATARRLWSAVEELTSEYNAEFALLKTEEEIKNLSGRVMSAVAVARCLDEETTTDLFLKLDSMNRDVPDDEAARLHRLAKIMLFVGSQVLFAGIEATRIAYYEEARRARSWLAFFSRKRHVAECNRLRANYDSFRGLGSEVSGAWSVLLSRWPSLGQLITALEAQVVGRLTQAHPDLLPWNDKGRPQQPAQVAPAPSPVVKQAKFCTKCGAKLPGGQKFCTKCGRPVT